MSTEPTEEDVQRGVNAVVGKYRHRSDYHGYWTEAATDILAAVLPLYRDRLLREAAEQIRCGPECSMGEDCAYADASRALIEMAEGRWLRSKVSGS